MNEWNEALRRLDRGPALVKAAAELGFWELALQLLDGMQAANITPGVEVFNAAIDACAKGDEWKRALKLLDAIKGLKSAVGDLRH